MQAIGRKIFTQTLDKIQVGSVLLKDGRLESVHGSKGGPSVTLTVNQSAFYTRLVLNADIGFAESFILGDIDVDDLTRLIKIFIDNRQYMNDCTLASAFIGNFVHYMAHTRLANTLTNSMNNISAHYDLGNELFTAFLDETMMYSSAVWMKKDETLFEAQMRKVTMMISKANIQPEEEVLEIGTGWGTLAIEAVKQRGCRVTTITLSKEQKRFAEERLEKESEDIRSRIQVVLCDYRRLPELFPGKKFDKIISIEMIEAVGAEFLSTYFNVCHKMLHEKHGMMVFQCIVMPDGRYESYKNSVDFINRYIFPGGHCPSVTALTQAVYEGSDKGKLIVDNLENIGPHYARTLRSWRERFLANFDEKLSKYPKFTTKKMVATSMMDTVSSLFGFGEEREEKVPFYSEEFKRKWLYYLCYCEAGFATRTLGNVQMVLTRECNDQMLQGLENIVL